MTALWTRLRTLSTCVQLAGLAVLTVLTAALTVLGLAVMFVGLTSMTTAVIENSRQLSNTYRRCRADVTGTAIPEPYLPLPAEAQTEWPGRGRRLTVLLGDPATWRDLGWLVLMPVLGVLLGLLPAALAFYALVFVAGRGLWCALSGAPESGDPLNPAAYLGDACWLSVPIGLGIVAMILLCANGFLHAHYAISALLLRPSASARVARLTETRAQAVDAQAAELRRIERDLHDGAQARIVSLGMTLRAAERLLDTDPACARELIVEARESARTALDELRDLVRGVHPPVLAERGLCDAVRAFALELPIPVGVHADAPAEPEAPIAAAVYFAVAELLTNVARHAPHATATVTVDIDGDRLRTNVTDTGTGGADPTRGSGLRGIEGRIATFDGTMTVTSPPGGPTTVDLEVPCASFSPRTSTS